MADNATGTDTQTPRNETPTNTATYNEGIDNAGRTISAIRDFDSLLGNPISTFLTSRTYKKRLRLELGEWDNFLYEKEQDIYLTPVLTASNFSRYLKSCKGAFKPRGKCKATAAWAQFLHGLGITPDKGIVSRKFVEMGEGETITLEVDGEVICHAVNLLGSLKVGPPSLIARSHGCHSTSIGKIHWRRDPDTNTFSLSYEPCNEDELSDQHRFFCWWPMKDSDDTMTRYFLSLELGTSYTALVWPPPSTPLHERVERPFELHRLLYKIPDTHRPVFLTGSWVKDSERVYRRALGGEQVDEFFENVCANLNPDPTHFKNGVEIFRDRLKSPPPHPLFYINKGEGPLSTPFGEIRLNMEMMQISLALECTLLSYGNHPEGSWKHKLYLCRETIPDMVWNPEVYIVDHDVVIIVPLDSTAALWHEKNLRMFRQKR